MSCCAMASLYHTAYAFAGSEYVLDTEYLGANFFDGWDFYTGHDPTGGFVTYYSRSSARLTGLINSSDTDPAYIGVDYTSELPITTAGSSDGAGRPSVRIATQRSWTHGLFIGDFNHAPSNICGAWPAFWTLGPNWPYTGEVDIMEGVNKAVSNAMSLHTNETCIVSIDSSTQLGGLSNTNCAYYPDYNIGCGVIDNRPSSYSELNSVDGGVYAMQWTSEYIRIWFFPRERVPEDIINKTPDPSSWGLPAANFMGNCSIDQHFQQHKIVLDTTFCGEYAGNPYVWNSTENSCAVDTGYSTCDAFVAKNPAAFRDAYWSVNYVRVYQLVDPQLPASEPQYIASLQPTTITTRLPVSSLRPTPTASLCPAYNFSIIQTGGLVYEIECDFDPPGPDLPPPYPNYRVHSFEDCVAGCTYWNTVNGTNLCGGVAYDETVAFCYWKKYIDQPPKYRKGFSGARLIYYGYPQITDDPRSQSVTSTSSFVETVPTPEYYRPSGKPSISTDTLTSFYTTSVSMPIDVPPPLGTATNETTRPTIDPGVPTISYSGTGLVPVTSVTSRVHTDNQTSQLTTSHNSVTANSTFAIITETLLSTSQPTDSMSSTASSSEPFSTGLLPPSTQTSSQSLTRTLLGSVVTTPSISVFTSKLSGPPLVDDFRYLGCRRSLSGRHTFILVENYLNMTIERCVNSCARAYYAALQRSECYCVYTALADTDLVTYPDNACSIPCPGNVGESCGGTVQGQPTNSSADADTAVNGTIKRRQNSNDTLLKLLTVYYNRAHFLTVTRSSTFTSTITVLSIASSTPINVYNFTKSDIAVTTAITTTWQDYCSNCPGYTTTRSTTITFSYQPGQAVVGAAMTVPMATVTRSCKCGIDGAASTIIVTTPHEEMIAALTESVGQIETPQYMSVVPGIEEDQTRNRSRTTSTKLYYSSIPALAFTTVRDSAALIRVQPVSSNVEMKTASSAASSTMSDMTSLKPLVPAVFTGTASHRYAFSSNIARAASVFAMIFVRLL